MQGEQADPAGDVNGVLLRMIPAFGNLVGNVVDGDDAVEEDDRDEKQESQREVVEKTGSAPGVAG